jgi:predicted small secreted protein
MKKTTALTLLLLGSLLTACNPFVGEIGHGTSSIDELCLQDGFKPCRPTPPGTIAE